MTPFVEFLAAIAVCAIIWYGGVSVIDGVMTTGELIAFLIYAINLANPTRRVAESVGNIQKSLAAADRVFAILDEQPEVQDKPDAKQLIIKRGRVEASTFLFPMKRKSSSRRFKLYRGAGTDHCSCRSIGIGEDHGGKPASPLL